jgi:adenylate cyclase
VYEIIMLLIVRFHIKRDKSLSNTLKIFNVFIEALLPGFFLFMLCLIESTPIFLDSPLFLFYFILIILSTLHLDIKLALLTGLLSALSYYIVTVWSISNFDPDFKTMHLHPFLYEFRSVIILAGGLCAVFVTNEIKKRNIKVSDLWKQKIEIEGLFGQQVSPQVAEALVKDQNQNHKNKVSILFLDVRNFSSFADQKDPQEVNSFQNNLFCPLIEIINSRNGIVNQILGDGFMATFGAPVKDKNHTTNAVLSGLEILDKIEELIEQGIIPQTKVGIGVHSGQVVTGNIGNEIRKQYSISGATVIIAARLEQLNKKLNTNFLVSKIVYDKVKELDLNFTKFKEIHIKGLENSFEVYQVSRTLS